MLNILVVNENFTGGGLETHIHSYYMELRKEHHFVFAFGNFESKLEFDPADVHMGFHFGWRASIGEFIEDVDRLMQLIHQEKIDVIHAHPFHSVFPAVVAGQLTGTPVVCTHHGTYSFAFPGGVNEALLLYYAYTELVNGVFSVSNTGKLALERAGIPNVVFMPNAVDSELYRRHTVLNNRRWAMISRLDSDVSQVASLTKLFDMLPQLPIDGVDVYGDGTQRKALEDYVIQNGLEDKVHFMGFCTDLYDSLDGKYNGIMGTGRVALEGLTMGYPVLEIGYGRVCGLLYGDIFQRAKESNFVANILPEYNSRTITAQLEQAYDYPEQFDFRQEMIDTFDIRMIAKAYVKQLSDLVPTLHANVASWFDAVKALPNWEVNFYSSQDVFQTMQEHIKPYIIDRNMLDLFLLGNGCAMLSSEMDQMRTSLLEWTQGQIEQEKARLEETRIQLQAQMEQEQVQLEETRTQLQTQIERERAQLEERQAQLQEQIEYYRKILAPLIWIRKSLGRVKRALKNWLKR